MPKIWVDSYFRKKCQQNLQHIFRPSLGWAADGQRRCWHYRAGLRYRSRDRHLCRYRHRYHFCYLYRVLGFAERRRRPEAMLTLLRWAWLPMVGGDIEITGWAGLGCQRAQGIDIVGLGLIGLPTARGDIEITGLGCTVTIFIVFVVVIPVAVVIRIVIVIVILSWAGLSGADGRRRDWLRCAGLGCAGLGCRRPEAMLTLQGWAIDIATVLVIAIRRYRHRNRYCYYYRGLCWTGRGWAAPTAGVDTDGIGLTQRSQNPFQVPLFEKLVNYDVKNAFQTLCDAYVRDTFGKMQVTVFQANKCYLQEWSQIWVALEIP